MLTEFSIWLLLVPDNGLVPLNAPYEETLRLQALNLCVLLILENVCECSGTLLPT